MRFASVHLMLTNVWNLMLISRYWKSIEAMLASAFVALVLFASIFHVPVAAAQMSEETSIIGNSPLYSLSGSTGWLNSKSLTAKDLKGKVVLVDFWDYSCINCIRAIPYVPPGRRNTRTTGW